MKKLLFQRIRFLLPFLLFFLLNQPGFAQGSGSSSYSPITKIDLGIQSLILSPGESYTFTITYEPETPAFSTLHWFVTDSSIASLDPQTATVTALRPGVVRILAESFDRVSYAICEVTVSGPEAKDADAQIPGESLIPLSKTDQKKISAESLLRFMNIIDGMILSDTAADAADKTVFSVSAYVRPGTEETESQRALSLGMMDAQPLSRLNIVTLLGAFNQIMAFTADNPDLIELFEVPMSFLIDPVPESADGSFEKSVNLEGNTEEITEISVLHDLGYYGSGSTIAFIDTGLDSNNEEFYDRVIAETCFGTDLSGDTISWQNVCVSEDSALPGNAITKKNFEHGTHVAAIAAGKNGFAQEANIIAVQAHSEWVWQCSADSVDYRNYACDNYSENQSCCSTTIFGNDKLKAYNYLLDLAEDGTDINAVNLSFGEGYFTQTCDGREDARFLNQMISAGMLPVAATGNNASNTAIASPACVSTAYSVGALADQADPLIASFSNQNTLVDILAPGTDIYSAIYPSGYGVMSGTSMAAPMVSGSVAILSEIFPDQEPSDYGVLLKDVSIKSADTRENGTVFNYSTTVLNFSRIADYIPNTENTEDESEVEANDNGSIRVTFPNIENADGLIVTVYDAETGDAVKVTIKVSHDDTGENTVLTISGSGLKDGKEYQIEAVPYHLVQGIRFKVAPVSFTGSAIRKQIQSQNEMSFFRFGTSDSYYTPDCSRCGDKCSLSCHLREVVPSFNSK